ncbi:MAG TPA: glycosyltransferase [Terriglobia bacterium]|nr:glycosyltransferase [Terriglobia bacterium]
MSASAPRKKIRILFLIDVMFYGGGTERHLAQVVTSLDKTRFDCTVCALNALDETAPSVRYIRARGIPCHSLSIHRVYGPRGLVQIGRLAAFVRKHRFDIVQTFHLISDTFGVVASRIGGAQVIVSSRRDMDALNGGMRRVARRVCGRFVDRYVAVCNAVADNISAQESVPRAKIQTIYNGVDFSQFFVPSLEERGAMREKLGIGRDAFVIGNVSVFRPAKDYASFFAALKKVAPFIPELKALAIGPGPLQQAYRRQCESDEVLRDIVVFTGGVFNVRDYVSIMDVACLCPSENEGLSNAILEEMAIGKPIVATDVGGNAELIVHEESGFITRPRNVDELADTFLRLYRSPQLRQEIGRKARERAHKHFAIETMIKNMEQFYEQLCGRDS